MTGQPSVTDLEEIDAPWNKQILVQELLHDGGFKMLRLRIREGRRITDLELDPATGEHLARTLSTWAETALKENQEQ